MWTATLQPNQPGEFEPQQIEFENLLKPGDVVSLREGAAAMVLDVHWLIGGSTMQITIRATRDLSFGQTPTEPTEPTELCQCCGAYWACGCDPPMVALPLIHETMEAARQSMGVSREAFMAYTGVDLLKERPRPRWFCKGCGRERTGEGA